MSLKAS